MPPGMRPQANKRAAQQKSNGILGDKASSFGYGVRDSITLGLGDELWSLVEATYDSALGDNSDGKTWKERQEKILADSRRNVAAAQERNPGLYLAGQAAGAVAGGVGGFAVRGARLAGTQLAKQGAKHTPQLVQTVHAPLNAARGVAARHVSEKLKPYVRAAGKGMARGTGIGVLYGFNSGEGGLRNRVGNMPSNALAVGAGGAIAAPVGLAVGRFAEAIGKSGAPQLKILASAKKKVPPHQLQTYVDRAGSVLIADKLMNKMQEERKADPRSWRQKKIDEAYSDMQNKIGQAHFSQWNGR